MASRDFGGSSAQQQTPPQVGVSFPLEMRVGEFKKRVSRWANAFDPTYRTLLWTIGNHINLNDVNGHAGAWSITYERIKQEMLQAQQQQGWDTWVPAYSTLKRYVATLRDHGVLKTRQTRYRRRGRMVWGAIEFTPNFNVVLKNGVLEAHDFLATFDVPEAKGSVDSGPRASHHDKPLVEPLGEPLVEPLDEPRSSHISSTNHNSKPVPQGSERSKQAGNDCLPGHTPAMEANDTEIDTWAEVTGIEGLNEGLFQQMLDGLDLGRVASEYLVSTFMDSKSNYMAKAHNPAAVITTVLPKWWEENRGWVTRAFDEDYPDEEMLAQHERDRLAAETARQEARAADEAAQKAARLAAEAVKKTEKIISDLDYRYNQDVWAYDFRRLLAAYREADLRQALESLREDVRQGKFGPFNKYPYFQQVTGGEKGLVERLADLRAECRTVVP